MTTARCCWPTGFATSNKDRFGAESLERPALVRTDDGWRLFYEAPLPDGSHELRSELVPAQGPRATRRRARATRDASP